MPEDMSTIADGGWRRRPVCRVPQSFAAHLLQGVPKWAR